MERRDGRGGYWNMESIEELCKGSWVRWPIYRLNSHC